MEARKGDLTFFVVSFMVHDPCSWVSRSRDPCIYVNQTLVKL